MSDKVTSPASGRKRGQGDAVRHQTILIKKGTDD